MTDTNIQIYLDQLKAAINSGDVPAIFANLLTYATESEASDIHIEPQETYCRIRIRVDGVMTEIVQYPRALHENLIAKFKIESGQMKPDEKRIPQDARVSNMTTTGKELDLRANTLPTVWGEKLVMRIVDKSKKLWTIDQLGIVGSNYNIIRRNLEYPHGIILTTGPTGSGKTQSLYSFLQYLNNTDNNILTYEDPVETRISGLNQSQIRADIGFDFASGLRGSLRQDPDIVMVGEIRDRETLDTAMEAAMTGHLVFSTIHTNSSAETITRAMNLGAKAYQIVGTFNLVLAQRLSRRIERGGSEVIDIKGSDEHRYMLDSLTQMGDALVQSELSMRSIDPQRYSQLVEGYIYRSDITSFSPNTKIIMQDQLKYRGRVGLYEMMEYTDHIKELLLEGKTAYEISKLALADGMIDLQRDGIFKVMAGITSPSEVYAYVKHS